jgi:hypothetical protein
MGASSSVVVRDSSTDFEYVEFKEFERKTPYFLNSNILRKLFTSNIKSIQIL